MSTPESGFRWDQRRSVGTLGTRFDLSQDGNALGYIEVCQLSAELARSNSSRGWADVGNLEVEDGVDPDTVVPHLYSVGPGGCFRAGSRPSSTTTRAGTAGASRATRAVLFQTLVTNARGWTMG